MSGLPTDRSAPFSGWTPELIDQACAEYDARAVEIDQYRQEAYGEGRKDQTDEFAELLPGPYYMDPPDGGSVTVLEQFRRMAEDAARYRMLRRGQHFSVIDGVGGDLRADDLDAAIDAARAKA